MHVSTKNPHPREKPRNGPPATRPVAAPYARLGLALLVGLLAAALAYDIRVRADARITSDFSTVHAASRAWLAGLNPYDAIGPGRWFEWGYGLYYPATAFLLVMPLAPLPRTLVDVLVVAAGCTGLAWCAWSRPTLWWALPSFALVASIGAVQWAPLLVTALTVPALQLLWFAKPTVGLAYFLAAPSRRTLIAGLTLTLLSLVLWPAWPWHWLAAIRSSGALYSAPIQRFGGSLLLLAWLKWRQPEARLMGTLACIPHLPQAYEALPLFLIPRTHVEGAILAALSWLVFLGNLRAWDSDWTTMVGVWLPALFMLLRPPR